MLSKQSQFILPRHAVLLMAGLTIFGVSATQAKAAIYYVSPNGSNFNTGLSWANAFSNLKTTLVSTHAGDQVWVEAGTYVGNFTGTDGVAVYGGFVGTETNIGQRNIAANPTILTANNYGTVYTISSTATHTNTLDGFTIENSAPVSGSNGGGVEDSSKDTLVVANCSFMNNACSGMGGGVSANGAANITNCVFASNTANEYRGGGGALYVGGTSNITMCTFMNNSASGSNYNIGGGIYATAATNITNCTFEGNFVSDLYGFGNDDGGAVYASGPCSVSKCSFADDSADYGAGVYLLDSTSSVSASTFSTEDAVNGSGGAIYCSEGSTTISGSSFLNDTSTAPGGAVFAGNGNIISIADCNFLNSSPSAIYLTKTGGSTTSAVKDCLIVGAGGNSTNPDGIDVDTGTSNATSFFTISNNTIVDSNVGLNINTNAGVASVANNIFYGDYGGLNNNISNFTISSVHNDLFANSSYNYQGTLLTSTDLQDDPLFVDPANDNFHLLAGSPILDAGNDNFVSRGDTDLDGNPRIQGAHVDIGCYEFTPLKVSLNSLAVDSDGDSRLLWVINNGADLWRVNPSSNFVADAKFGPFTGWTPTAISASSTGGTVMQWVNSNGAQDVWLLDANGNFVTDGKYGPFPGWGISGIGAGGGDGNIRLLWINSGVADVWVTTPNGNYVTDQKYGAYAGWSPIQIGTAADNSSRLLWVNTNGKADVYTLAANGAYVSEVSFGPFAGWTATGLAVARDGKTRLTWTNVSGLVDIWDLDVSGNYVGGANFGPFPNWAMTLSALAPDDSGRLVWTKTDGTENLWSTDATSGQNVLSSADFGPF